VIAAAGLALSLLASQQKPGGQAVPPRDAWFGADKLKHFFVAAFTQSVAYTALQSARVRHDHALAGAWAVTAAASVAKEFHDKRTTGLFSVRDLAWDAAGAGVATVLMTRSQRSRPSAEPATTDVTVEQSLGTAGSPRRGGRTPVPISMGSDPIEASGQTFIPLRQVRPPLSDWTGRPGPDLDGGSLLSPLRPGSIFRAPSTAAGTVRGTRPLPPPSA